MDSNRITDKSEIRKLMHAYMLAPSEQRAPFLVEIFTREHRPGGTIFEGARPLGACTDGSGETTYSLTNGDSEYTQAITAVKLSGIEYVIVL